MYEKALKMLKGKEMVLLGLRFAKLERKLNDSERARAIYTHLSQFCNPSVYQEAFWTVWEHFELQSGNADTFEDLLRSKRIQELRYSVVDPVL